MTGAVEGPYGWCATRDCHNPATTDIGFPLCRSCDEANDLGAAWSTANSQARDAWDVTIGEGWIEKVEARIRERVAESISAITIPPFEHFGPIAAADWMRTAAAEAATRHVEQIRYTSIATGEDPPWGNDQSCPICGEPDLPLKNSVPPGLTYISHCGKSWLRGPMNL